MGKIIELFEKNRLLVNVMIIIIIAAGIYSYFNIQKEAFPAADFDILIMQVVYPGASAQNVEQNAVIAIEDELQSINGINEFTSMIIENAAIITVRLDMEIKDTRPIKDEIFRKMQNVPNISKDVSSINITEADPRLLPIYNLGVSFKEGMEGDEKELYYFSKNLEKELKNVDGVANVQVEGRTDPEIQILVNSDSLHKYYVSLTEIVNSLALRNVRATSGILKSDLGELTENFSDTNKNKILATVGEFEYPMEVTNVIIRSVFNGKTVRIDDIAEVEETFIDKSVYMKVDRSYGYSLNIVKKGNSDIISTIKNVNKFLKDNADMIPNNIEVTTISDSSRTINDLINSVTSNLIGGFAIIFIILIVFLDFKSALFTSLGIFIVLFVSLIYMWKSDITFNVISLVGIITVLGMIVDNSIVVSENVFNFRQKGYRGIEATKRAVENVFMPILVSTLTTIVAFLPMLFVSGTMGKFINQYPKVVIVALLASLFQAVLILPNNLLTKEKLKGINSTQKSKKKGKWKNILDFDRDKLFDKMKIPFTAFLKRMLKIRYVVVIFFVVLLGLSVFLANDSFEKFILLYDTSSDAIVINIDTEIGTPASKTAEYIERLENIIDTTIDKNYVISVYSLIGKHLDENAVNISGELDNMAGITINLIPANERKKTAYLIVEDLNKEIEKNGMRNELKLLTVNTKLFVNPGKAVDIKIIGNDMTLAKEAKEKIKEHLLSLPGIINYDDDDKMGQDELKVTFDYDKIAELGVNVALVARELRTAYSGTVATSIQSLENKLDFRVRLDKKHAYDTNVLENLLIPNVYNRLLYLKDVAKIDITNSQASIKHFNGKKAITMNADIEQGKNTATRVMYSVRNYFKTISKDYPGVTIDFAGEVKETAKPIVGLAWGYLVAILGIYIVLLLQFNKFFQPIMILTIIPFGTIGVFLAFAAHRMPMSFVGAIGIVGLAGVVVNNGIIMIDLINRILENSKGATKETVFNSIVEGASERLRPIFLTTSTTIMGLLPTVYGIGGRADLIVPIVMALAYGLLFASLLTLILLPCVFMISFDLKLIKFKQN